MSSSEPVWPPGSQGLELAPQSFNSGFCGMDGTLGLHVFGEALTKPRGRVEILDREAALSLCHRYPACVVIMAGRIADECGPGSFLLLLPGLQNWPASYCSAGYVSLRFE